MLIHQLEKGQCDISNVGQTYMAITSRNEGAKRRVGHQHTKREYKGERRWRRYKKVHCY